MDQNKIIIDEHIQCTEHDDYENWTRQVDKQTFNILSLNIRSLAKHWDELKLIICNAEVELDVIILTETNIRDSNENLFFLNNYDSFFQNRVERRGGGVAVFIKTEYKATRIKVIGLLNYENIEIKIKLKN